MILELLRHGETERGGGFRGSVDDPLTSAGWAQMRAAVDGLNGWDAVVSSPLQRCAAFAAELADSRGVAVDIRPDLRELHFGLWEGRHPADLMLDQADELGQFWNDPYAYTPPQAELVAAFRQRVIAELASLALRYAGQRLLVVTHAGVMRLLLARARELADRDLLQVQVGYAELVRLHRYEDGTLKEEKA
ncbi:histidine phosphatase family protein [Halopseudomonas nanhaiensis]|uniref:histidine phosphatase family protein n=1 Tax=Halopseudomonas nanhaiensis TaxID=2830842 RepID=UPI001CBBABCB|nr:histidine phosphatase family protein [Halopseudomonas nanhaiensis]UAW97097.1 histidine phosphatase family protein [Halopseudomonas nanhaiensis]